MVLGPKFGSGGVWKWASSVVVFVELGSMDMILAVYAPV